MNDLSPVAKELERLDCTELLSLLTRSRKHEAHNKRAETIPYKPGELLFHEQSFYMQESEYVFRDMLEYCLEVIFQDPLMDSSEKNTALFELERRAIKAND